MTSLIITDQNPDAWIATIAETGSSQSQWDVLPLGFSAERYRQEYGHILDHLFRWDVVESVVAAGEARCALRMLVPSLLADLRKRPVEGGKTIPDLLQFDGFNAWWFLEIAEKSAYRGPFVNRLYYLALIRAVLEDRGYQEVRLFLDDRVLADAVATIPNLLRRSAVYNKKRFWSMVAGSLNGVARCVWNAVRAAALHLVQVLLLRGLRLVSHERLPSSALLIFSFYPAMWAAPYSRSASEWFFGALPEYFPSEAPVRYATWMTARPYEIWRRRKQLRAFVRDRSPVCLLDLAGLSAVRMVLSPSWLWMQVRLRLQWQNRLSFDFLGFDVKAVIVEEMSRSLSSTELFRDLLIHQAWRELMKAMPVSGILYRIEFQPFEAAILYGVGKQGRTVAFMHPVFGENYLPYMFVPGELGVRDDSSAIPLPDLILTTGRFGREVMINNGYCPESVEVCGPVRHRELLKRQRPSPEKETEVRERLGIGLVGDVLVVGTAVCREEAEGLIIALQKCVEDLRPFIVCFKSHPAVCMDDRFTRSVGDVLGPGRYRVLTSISELYDALSVARVAVLNHSTVVLEALLLGALPIVFDGGAVFDPKIMEPYECGGLVAKNSLELTKALRMAVNSREEVEALMLQLLSRSQHWFDRSELDPYQRFIDSLRKHAFLGETASAS